MKVSQLRDVLRAAAEFKAMANDTVGADELVRFADALAPSDRTTVTALAKQMTLVGKQLAKPTK